MILSGAVVEVARRAARNSWWCVPLLFTLSIGAGAAIWFLPLLGLNGHLEDELVPACKVVTPPLLLGFTVFGVWIAFLAPIFLFLIWLIGRLSSRRQVPDSAAKPIE